MSNFPISIFNLHKDTTIPSDGEIYQVNSGATTLILTLSSVGIGKPTIIFQGKCGSKTGFINIATTFDTVKVDISDRTVLTEGIPQRWSMDLTGYTEIRCVISEIIGGESIVNIIGYCVN